LRHYRWLETPPRFGSANQDRWYKSSVSAISYQNGEGSHSDWPKDFALGRQSGGIFSTRELDASNPWCPIHLWGFWWPKDFALCRH